MREKKEKDRKEIQISNFIRKKKRRKKEPMNGREYGRHLPPTTMATLQPNIRYSLTIVSLQTLF